MPAMPLSAPSRPLNPSQQRVPFQSGGADCYTLRLNAEESLIRAILVESIDCLFSDIDETGASGRSDSMDEPLLDQIDDQRVQFHGQLTAPPRVRRRQKLVASRAVFHAVVRR
jgi:putative ubiquitin-RnfH superfamily antitoxin RatB of RatAB toxin-antitoxin module